MCDFSPLILTLTFDQYNSRFGVWGPRRLLRGFQFHSPSREDSRMGRRRRAFLSDTGPLRLIAGSLIFLRPARSLSSTRGSVEWIIREGSGRRSSGCVGLLVGVPLHLIDRFSADALEHFPGL